MKTLRTAPQFLEHYLPVNNVEKLISKYTYRGFYPQILKAMREYAKYQVERQYEKLYQEAKKNVEFQYGVTDLASKIKKEYKIFKDSEKKMLKKEKKLRKLFYNK